MAEVQICEVSLAQQWVWIVYEALMDCHGYNTEYL
jgi:hypothetical protein